MPNHVSPNGEKNSAPRIKATGLWAHKDRNGNLYMEGTLSPTVKVFIFKNGMKKKGSKEPDYELFFAPVLPKPAAESEADVDDEDGDNDDGREYSPAGNLTCWDDDDE